MRTKFLFIIVLFLFLFWGRNISAAVVINEVFYDPEGTDTGKEYIILYNNDNLSIDVTGYQLNAVSGDYYTIPSFTLNSKSFIAVHWRKDGTNTQTDLYTGTSGFNDNMGNTNGWIALFKNSEHTKDSIIDYIEYGAGGKTYESKAVDAGIWTAGDFIPDIAEGKTIKLKTDGIDNNSPNDWMETVPSIIPEEETPPSQTTPQEEIGSTIGKPPLPDAGNNIIAFIGQEIKFDGTKSTDPDGNELAYSWNMGDGKLMEKPVFTYKYSYPGTYLVSLMVYDGLYYATDTIEVKIQTQNIIINEFMANPSGKDDEEEWIEIYNDSDSVTDISGWQLDDIDGGSKPFIFPKNTLIAPKSYIVFSRQITNIALNNDKDGVRLLLPEGVVFQEINYEKPPLGKSSARTDEGFVWSVPTPGAINISGITISEDKNTTYQQTVKPEIVKESSQDYSWYYQNAGKREIEGGYAETQINQLAAIKEMSSQKEPTNLVLIIGLIILSGFIIGFLLIKFGKKHKSGLPLE